MSKVPQKEMSKNFCNILRKTIATGFVFYCDTKNSDTLQGSSHHIVFGRLWSKMGVAFSTMKLGNLLYLKSELMN